MSHESDPTEPITVSEGAVTVEKSYAADEFPVPAMRFDIESDADDPVDIRIVDNIPEDFPMDSVGFHPDFESDNWTAYKDNRVEFERTLNPNEALTTVYGIRLDTEDQIQGFLHEPQLEISSEQALEASADAVDEILGEDANQLVRDVLAGERDAVPGMESAESESEAADEPAIELEEPTPEAEAGAEPDTEIELEEPESEPEIEIDAEPEASAGPNDDDLAEAFGEDSTQEPEPTIAPESAEGIESGPSPRSIDDDTLPAVHRRQPEAEPLGQEPEIAESTEGQAETADTQAEPATETETEPKIAPEPELEAESEPEPESAAEPGPGIATESIAAALATEIREGEVDDEDLETLRDELDLGVPASVDARIRRLQSQMQDIQAYSGAMEQFLDENGTAQELIDEFREQTEDLADTVHDLTAEIEHAETDRAELHEGIDEMEDELDDLEDEVEDDLEDLENDLDDMGAEVASVRRRVRDVDDRIEGIHEEVTANGDSIANLDSEMGEVRDDLAALDADIVQVEDQLGDELTDVQAELAEIQDELDEIEEFRERLNSVFGGGQQP